MSPRTVKPVLGATEWRAGDDRTLPFERWPNAKQDLPRQSKAVLICLHGLSGAASDFWPLGEKLPGHGIVVYGLQLRSQGHDPEISARGDIRDAREWQRDLREFHDLVAERHPREPIFWLAESMGALIALHALDDLPANARKIRGLVMLSPAVELRERLPGWRYLATRVAMFLAPGRRITLSSLDESRVAGMRITSDTTHSAQAAQTPHYVKMQSLRLLREIEKMMSASTAVARRTTIPVLVLYTANDPVTSQQQIEHWFSHIQSPDKCRLFFPNNYHLILHDDERWKAVEQIASWIIEHE
ncbi:MAG: alpha/beta fold hydrolase [Verrucomicrobiales bacterium]